MRQTELRLSNKDRKVLEEWRSKGLRHAREVNRAHILAALDEKVPEALICQVWGRSHGDLAHASGVSGGRAGPCAARRGATRGASQVRDGGRGGGGRAGLHQTTAGAKRWTLVLLEREARSRPSMQDISRETIRRLLKKTASSRGEK